MNFTEAHRLLRSGGAMSIPFQASGASFVDVWASELISGPRKGQGVIRVQLSNSSSTLDESQWNAPESSLIRHLRYAIVEKLSQMD